MDAETPPLFFSDGGGEKTEAAAGEAGGEGEEKKTPEVGHLIFLAEFFCSSQQEIAAVSHDFLLRVFFPFMCEVKKWRVIKIQSTPH